MVNQTIDGVSFRLKEPYDFGFLRSFGRVFKVYDEQDSGNLCFGLQNEHRRIFVKFAGCQPFRYEGDIGDAVERLRQSVPAYLELAHPQLIQYLWSQEIGGGFAVAFEWFEGACMGRMYEASHAQIMALPLEEKDRIFQAIMSFVAHAHDCGWVAIDFYDASILYNLDQRELRICDIDVFERKPYVNSMGRMWGSSRFMAPEEYQLGATIDELTNVFTLGRMGFSIFTDSRFDRCDWPWSDATYEVLGRATSPDRALRYSHIEALRSAWIRARASDGEQS